MTNSERGKDWIIFNNKVLDHIETYTVAQYGDKGADLASDFSAQQFNDQIKKYAARFGKNSRPGQQALDFLKIAHYAQMAHDALISVGIDHGNI